MEKHQWVAIVFLAVVLPMIAATLLILRRSCLQSVKLYSELFLNFLEVTVANEHPEAVLALSADDDYATAVAYRKITIKVTRNADELCLTIENPAYYELKREGDAVSCRFYGQIVRIQPDQEVQIRQIIEVIESYVNRM